MSGRHGGPLGLGTILGGAAGNLVDRLFRAPGRLRGHVVDFLAIGRDAGVQRRGYRRAGGRGVVDCVVALGFSVQWRRQKPRSRMPTVDRDRRVSSEDSPPGAPWHETPVAMLAAGIGAVVAIGALVFAIVTTSHHSVSPDQPERLTPVSPTRPALSRSSTLSTAGTTPRTPVSTSEDAGTSTAPPPPEDAQATTAPPTTTPTNHDHVESLRDDLCSQRGCVLILRNSRIFVGALHIHVHRHRRLRQRRDPAVGVVDRVDPASVQRQCAGTANPVDRHGVTLGAQGRDGLVGPLTAGGRVGRGRAVCPPLAMADTITAIPMNVELCFRASIPDPPGGRISCCRSHR